MNSGSKSITKVTIASGNGIGTATTPQRAAQVEGIAERQQRIINSILQYSPSLLEDVSRSYERQIEELKRNQFRYRQKFRLIAESLERDIQRLREQIQQHELERQLLVSRPPTSTTPWSVVSEYYRLFRNGIKGTPLPNSTSNQTTCDVQMNFLSMVMSPVVSVNSGFGVDTIIQEWLAVPLMHQDLTVRLIRLEYDEGNVILATVKSSTTITEEMLRCEFPFSVDRTNDDQTSRLVAKLVGQQLVIPTTVRFEWDSKADRVLSMHSNADLVTPFLKLLGNVQDTTLVIDNSLLSKATSA
ncbi:hypothetical protein PHMEG_00026098 [Phytophthora megakarya]|uniref:Bzip transcription factor n=1 Tax=Phytophthora megakarya TaxID=4795 RepID=A0A225VAJ1_9STRA|nr:hypothetical protein PHMEG_00026098 [Phytophthora megakarya]